MNKEKLINYIKKRIDDLNKESNKWNTEYYTIKQLTNRLFELKKLLKKIENGEFDNE